jgi:hypothetical protein
MNQIRMRGAQVMVVAVNLLSVHHDGLALAMNVTIGEIRVGMTVVRT